MQQNNENMPPNTFAAIETNGGLSTKGAQQQDRNEMMSHANLAQAAQSFNQ